MGETASPPSAPRISVVIPAGKGPEHLRRCLESLAHVQYALWDILLIDQSDDDGTRSVAGDFARRLPCLAFQHVDWKGAARARNLGIQSAGGEIVAFLDDDCTVEPGWLAQVAGVFGRHPEASLVFGCVRMGVNESRDYFVPTHEIEEERSRRGRLATLRTEGWANCMYVRRAVTQDLGLFDVQLGPGGRFRSQEEPDYIYRALAAGHTVVQTPAIAVSHHGAHEYQSGAARRWFRNAFYGRGAVHMKMLRCGDPFALVAIAYHAWRCAAWIDLGNLLFRRGPSHLAFLAMYVRGLFASFELGVDRRRRLYVAR